MEQTTEIAALLKLIDDPDEEVFGAESLFLMHHFWLSGQAPRELHGLDTGEHQALTDLATMHKKSSEAYLVCLFMMTPCSIVLDQ